MHSFDSRTKQSLTATATGQGKQNKGGSDGEGVKVEGSINRGGKSEGMRVRNDAV